jgi:hypothetical protein
MSQSEEEIKEIEEEIAEDEGTASLDTRFTIFKREFKSHVLNTRILFSILILIGIIQTIFVILIYLKLFYPWLFP